MVASGWSFFSYVAAWRRDKGVKKDEYSFLGIDNHD